MSSGTDYKKLLERIAKGDRAAESELIQEFSRGLQYILYGETRQRELSEDLSQDALIVILQKARAGLIQNPVALPSYVRNTGINLLIAFKRKKTRQKTDSDFELIQRVKSPESSPLVKLSKEQKADFVRKTLARLPVERDKEILRRHYLLEQDKEITCSELNLTASHYDRVLFRARSRLKQLLQEDSDYNDFDPTIVALMLGALLLLSYAQNHSFNEVREMAWSNHSCYYDQWRCESYG